MAGRGRQARTADDRVRRLRRGRPSTIRVRTASAQARVRPIITLRLTQVESQHVPLDDAVFDADVPRDAAPLTLEELRSAGPLGGE